MTLYDTVYLYLKLASEVLSETGVKKEHITNGTFMYQRAKNYKTSTSNYCYFAITVGDLVSVYCCSQLLQAIILFYGAIACFNCNSRQALDIVLVYGVEHSLG